MYKDNYKVKPNLQFQTKVSFMVQNVPSLFSSIKREIKKIGYWKILISKIQ